MPPVVLRPNIVPCGPLRICTEDRSKVAPPAAEGRHRHIVEIADDRGGARAAQRLRLPADRRDGILAATRTTQEDSGRLEHQIGCLGDIGRAERRRTEYGHRYGNGWIFSPVRRAVTMIASDAYESAAGASVDPEAGTAAPGSEGVTGAAAVGATAVDAGGVCATALRDDSVAIAFSSGLPDVS